MRSFSLHFVKQARDSTRQGALRKLVCASCLRKLHCASCSAQVAPRKLLRQVGPCKLLCANCAPCKLLCASWRNRTRDPPVPGAGSRTTRQLPRTSSFEQQKSQKPCTSTTPIPAEGCASRLEIAKNHGFLHLDHADPRRGSREQVRNRKKPWVFAPRPRRSPQRVARAG